MVEEIVWRLHQIKSQAEVVSAFSLISLHWRYLLILSAQTLMVKQQHSLSPPPSLSLSLSLFPSEAHLH